MLAELQKWQQIIWVANIAGGVCLFLLVVARRNYRAFPAFTLYIVADPILSVLVFLTYRRWGFNSIVYWWTSWCSLAIIVSARAVAVTELCKHLLSRYPGIWALAQRVLLSCAAAALIYSWVAAEFQWKLALVRATRDLELAIAVVIVGVFVFVRLYGVEAPAADRLLGVGFCVYSCFSVLNITVFERFFDHYAILWNLLRMAAFFGCLLLWTWALRKQQAEAEPEEALLPGGIYQALAPQINLRLRLLNERLSQFQKTEATRN